MKRTEASEVLKEMSNRCGINGFLQAVVLSPNTEPTPQSSIPEQTFRLSIQTASLDTSTENCINTVLKERGLKLLKTQSFTVIYRQRESNKTFHATLRCRNCGHILLTDNTEGQTVYRHKQSNHNMYCPCRKPEPKS